MSLLLAAAASTSTNWIDLNALWKIIVFGLLCGAGLPIIFAVGLRFLSLPAGTAGRTSEESEQVYFGNVGGAIVAGFCFAIVLAAIGVGIFYIVSA